MTSSKMLPPEEFSEFLQANGITLPTILPLKGGANNRVYQVNTHHQKFVLKKYFHDPKDTRERLKHEYAFLNYAWQLGIRNIPQPFAKCDKNHLGLYSFLPGKIATVNDVTDANIQAAVKLFRELNEFKIQGAHLPNSSEACFSGEDYFHTVEKKLSRFENLPSSPFEKDVKAFLKKMLLPKWNRIKQHIIQHEILPLTMEERCISPSDFGFHNVLIMENQIYFIDFEYAGWDDPAKTICDFFLQPKVPIPMHYFTEVAEKMAAAANHPEKCLARLKFVFPVCQIRWCLIMLNVFSQTGQKRRHFSDAEEIQQKEAQLNKVKEFFQTIQA